MLKIIQISKNPIERKPTIYEALKKKLGREPTNAELKTDVQRILSEGTQELAAKGKLRHQRGKMHRNPKKPEKYWTYKAATDTPELSDLPSGAFKGTAAEFNSLSPGMRREIYRFAMKNSALKNPSKKRKTKRVKRKSRIIRTKKNPAKRRIECIIAGIQQLRPRRFKIVYYTGKGFTADRHNAKRYPGSAARMEAKRILPMLPPSIIQISTERT